MTKEEPTVRRCDNCAYYTTEEWRTQGLCHWLPEKRITENGWWCAAFVAKKEIEILRRGKRPRWLRGKSSA